jgi:hypothetical protein
VIAAEDTRRVQILLDHLGCGGRRDVRSTFDGNEAARAEELAGVLAAGRSVALVSDAGTPGVSDPGARVVRAAIAAGAPVVVIPGPVAAIAALVASGLATDRFLFLGFPPRDAGAARRAGGIAGRRARDDAVLRGAGSGRRDPGDAGGGVGRRPRGVRVARADQALRGARARHARRAARRGSPTSRPAASA